MKIRYVISVLVILALALAACSGHHRDRDDDGIENPYSGSGTPSAPAGVTAAALSSSSIAISWNAVSGAASYRVYYATSSSGTKNLAGNVSGGTTTTYTHTGLNASTTYYYFVTAVNSSGTASEYSSYAYAATAGASGTLYSSWSNGSIAAGDFVIYTFSVSSGTTYRIWWNDSYEGNGTKTLDVKVSARYTASGTSIFSGVDSGWTTAQSFTASSSGTVTVTVQGYSSSSSGTFGICYSTSGTRPAT